VSPAEASVARHVVVWGRVQGVFFRSSCQERARALGVAGWVRNTSTGSVELWAEGDPARIDDLVRWCGDGPGHAVVERVEVDDVTPTGARGFHVR